MIDMRAPDGSASAFRSNGHGFTRESCLTVADHDRLDTFVDTLTTATDPGSPGRHRVESQRHKGIRRSDRRIERGASNA